MNDIVNFISRQKLGGYASKASKVAALGAAKLVASKLTNK